MRHQSFTAGYKSTNDAIADMVVNLKDYDGLSFGERMTLSQIKIKCLMHGSSSVLSNDEVEYASSALARSTATWTFHS